MLSRQLTNRPSVQPDVPLFLVLIPLINADNYYLTYPNIRFGWYLIATYLIDTITGYAAWWYIRTLIFWLDQRILYTNCPLKRIIIQGLLTTPAGLFVIIASTEMLTPYCGTNPCRSAFTSTIFSFL